MKLQMNIFAFLICLTVLNAEAADSKAGAGKNQLKTEAIKASRSTASTQETLSVMEITKVELTNSDDERPMILASAKIDDGASGKMVDLAVPAGGDPLRVVAARHRVLFAAFKAAQKEKIGFNVSGGDSTQGGHTIFVVNKVTFDIP